MATAHQKAVLEATSAEHSAWVSAHAGSGKTHVLITRLVTLMLSGAKPEKLLCLTYTRTAAAEMKQRLNDLLGEWAVLENGKLKAEMQRRTGLTPSREQIEDVRRLFARAMDAPGGLKIQTIHAFCETLLNRFPLEAGVSPGFKVMDERAFQELAAEAQDKILRRNEPEGLKTALGRLTRRLNEKDFQGLCRRITERRRHFPVDEGGSRLEELLKYFGLKKQIPLGAFGKSFLDGLSRRRLARLAGILKDSSANDQKLSGRITGLLDALEHFDDFESLQTALDALFMTADGPRQRFATKAAAREHPEETGYLSALQGKYLDLRERFLVHLNLQISLDICRFADALLSEIDTTKRREGYLDYDDLIHCAEDLLTRRSETGWVLYKLDGGIDHILVDEAQDTSPRQWSVISAIAEEFFAGEGVSEKNRTLFAVGDEKQSIFSFQGADPLKFDEMRNYFADKASQAKNPFNNVELTTSWRSTPEILRLVDLVCGNEIVRSRLTRQGVPIAHSNRRKADGLVELWPIEKGATRPSADYFDPGSLADGAGHTSLTPQQKVARKITDRIAAWRDDPDSNITPGDILILVQNRGPFVQDMIKALKTHHPPIAVAGADRMKLTEQLAVKDLICAGQLVLLPQDDLTLATFLRSPLGGVSEDDLMKLCLDRGGRSLVKRLTEAVKDREDEAFADRLAPALEMLETLSDNAAKMPPYEFYAHLLDALSGREKLRARLGSEIDDPVEEFLIQALDYERQNVPTLQGFLQTVLHGEVEIKRDMEQGGGAVRIMTVHGAKGLEAPVVFLPDTCRPAVKSASVQAPVSLLPAGAAVWQPAAKLASLNVKKTDQEARERDSAEHKRLLYVALTRARDRLYIAGYLPARRSLPEDCWYGLIEKEMRNAGRELPDEAGWRLGNPASGGGKISTDAPRKKPPSSGRRPDVAAPGWLGKPAKRESLSEMPLAPSDYFRRSGHRALSQKPDLKLRQRGTVIHQLLEGLAGLEAGARQPAAEKFLSHYPELAEEGAELTAEVTELLEHPDMQMLFGSGSRAEVPVGGQVLLPDGRPQLFSGRIDRYVETPEAILIADYKTTRDPPPLDRPIQNDIAVQLEIYRRLVSAACPEKEVKCAVVWTAGPLYRAVSAEELAAAWEQMPRTGAAAS